jgi:hypothetical protein
MHYGAFANSANGQPTITPNDSSVNINRLGQRNGLSQGDIDGVRFLYTAFGTHWERIEGGGYEIAVGSEGSVYVVGTTQVNGTQGHDVYQLLPVRRLVPLVVATKIAVAADGALWHLNALRDIYRGLTQIDGKGLEIAAGRDGSVYVIGTTRQPGAHGNDVYKFNGSGWNVVPLVAATKIAVAPDGTLWHLNDLGDVYRGLEQVRAAKMREIGIGADGSVYLIWLRGRPRGGPGYGLFRWFEPQGWYIFPETAATKVAVDPSGLPWVLNERLEIYRRVR